MTPEQIQALCDAAMRRITASINRSHGQHVRHMLASWNLREIRETWSARP